MEQSDASHEQLLAQLQALQTQLTAQQQEVARLNQQSTQAQVIEEALRQSEERYRLLFNLAPEAIFVHREGVLIYTNPACNRMLGIHETSQLVGKSLFDFLLPQYHEVIWQSILESENTHQPTPVMEVELVGLDGGERQLEWIAAPIIYEGHEARQVWVRDVTRRKQTEQELKNSEAKFRLLAETVTVPIFVFSGVNYVYTNPAFINFTGYSPEELSTMTFWQIIVPEFQEEIRQKGLARQQGWVIGPQSEYQIIRKSGERRWVQSMVKVIQYEDGKGGLGTMVDITARKNLEQRLVVEHERLLVVLDSIKDCVIITDQIGQIVLMNEISEQLVGWTNTQAQGEALTNVLQLVDATSGQTFPNLLAQLLNAPGGFAPNGGARLVSAGGSSVAVDLVAAPVYASAGDAVVSLIVVFRPKPTDSATEQPAQSVNQLESIGVLARGLAHDFNNILTALTGNLGLAKMQLGLEQPEVGELLSEAENAVFQASRLTRQFMTLGRGVMPVKSRVNLAIVLQSWTIFALRGSEVNYEFEFSPGLWPVSIDEGQISQVVHNLVINAEQAMQGQGKLTVRAVNWPSAQFDPGLGLTPGDYVRIEVQDEGGGVAPENLTRIFEPYYSTKQQGSGLGLAMARAIVWRHGGWITLSSEVGRGTIFVIYLPANRPG